MADISDDFDSTSKSRSTGQTHRDMESWIPGAADFRKDGGAGPREGFFDARLR